MIKSIDYVYGYFRDNNEETIVNKTDYISMIETFKYDDNDNVIEETMNNVKGNIFKKHLFKYDQNGNLIEEGRCKNYKSLLDQSKCDYKPSIGWNYNQKNQLTKKFSMGKWSPHNTDTYYKYDLKGREIEAKGYYIKTDTILGYHYTYEYDEFGNMTKEEEIVGNYRSIGFDKYKIEKTKFDEFKNVILQEYITSNNQRIKVIQYDYVYDEEGNWIEQKKKEGKNIDDLEVTKIKIREIKYYNR